MTLIRAHPLCTSVAMNTPIMLNEQISLEEKEDRFQYSEVNNLYFLGEFVNDKFQGDGIIVSKYNLFGIGKWKRYIMGCNFTKGFDSEDYKNLNSSKHCFIFKPDY